MSSSTKVKSTKHSNDTMATKKSNKAGRTNKDGTPVIVNPNFKVMVSELSCTYIFLFVTFGVAISAVRSGWDAQTTLILSALTMAFTAVSVTYVFGSISGAHFNPMITLATTVFSTTKFATMISYWAGQFIGGALAMATICAIFPDPISTFNYILILPPVTDTDHAYTVVFMETALSFILVTVFMAARLEDGLFFGTKANGPYLKSSHISIAIGFIYFVLPLIGTSVSGSAFNPLRAFFPAIFANNWTNQHYIWLGDIFGAILAGSIAKWSHYMGLIGDVNTASAGMSCFKVFKDQLTSNQDDEEGASLKGEGDN